MRDGKFILKKDICSISLDNAVEIMLGRKIEENFPVKRNNPREICLHVEKLKDSTILEDVSTVI